MEHGVLESLVSRQFGFADRLFLVGSSGEVSSPNTSFMMRRMVSRRVSSLVELRLVRTRLMAVLALVAETIGQKRKLLYVHRTVFYVHRTVFYVHRTVFFLT